MGLTYVDGKGFNSKHELEALIKELSKPEVPTAALRELIDMFISVTGGTRNGFVSIKGRWVRSSVENILLSVHSNVAAALRVPGNGRDQTYDLTFIGVALHEPGDCQSDDCRRRSCGICLSPGCDVKNEFVRSMRQRMTNGDEHEWPRS